MPRTSIRPGCLDPTSLTRVLYLTDHSCARGVLVLNRPGPVTVGEPAVDLLQINALPVDNSSGS